MFLRKTSPLANSSVDSTDRNTEAHITMFVFAFLTSLLALWCSDKMAMLPVEEVYSAFFPLRPPSDSEGVMHY